MHADVISLYQNGLSAREVAEKLDVSVKMVYTRLRRAKIARRRSTKSNDIRFRKTPLSFTIPGELTQGEEVLKVCALSLYWGEGAKSQNTLDIANTDIGILQIFLRFLREIMHVDESRLRVMLYCFENQDSTALCRFWSEMLNIPLIQFHRPYVRVIRHEKNSRIMPNGVAHIRYSDKRLHEYVMSEIERLKSWAGGRAVKCT